MGFDTIEINLVWGIKFVLNLSEFHQLLIGIIISLLSQQKHV